MLDACLQIPCFCFTCCLTRKGPAPPCSRQNRRFCSCALACHVILSASQLQKHNRMGLWHCFDTCLTRRLEAFWSFSLVVWTAPFQVCWMPYFNYENHCNQSCSNNTITVWACHWSFPLQTWQHDKMMREFRLSLPQCYVNMRFPPRIPSNVDPLSPPCTSSSQRGTL